MRWTNDTFLDEDDKPPKPDRNNKIAFGFRFLFLFTSMSQSKRIERIRLVIIGWASRKLFEQSKCSSNVRFNKFCHNGFSSNQWNEIFSEKFSKMFFIVTSFLLCLRFHLTRLKTFYLKIFFLRLKLNERREKLVLFSCSSRCKAAKMMHRTRQDLSFHFSISTIWKKVLCRLCNTFSSIDSIVWNSKSNRCAFYRRRKWFDSCSLFIVSTNNWRRLEQVQNEILPKILLFLIYVRILMIDRAENEDENESIVALLTKNFSFYRCRSFH